MFSLRTRTDKLVSPSLIRGYAQVVPGSPKSRPTPSALLRSRRRKAAAQIAQAQAQAKAPVRVPVKEDHGLWGFFRRQPGDNLVGESRYEVFETPQSMRIVSGRAWEASELRLKNFKDLHTLWYAAAREQNLLATQKEEVRRMGVSNEEMQISQDKVRNCRKTMAHIKLVLNERRLAFEGALKLAEEQRLQEEGRPDEADEEVHEFLQTQTNDEQQKVRVYRAQRRNMATGKKVFQQGKRGQTQEASTP